MAAPAHQTDDGHPLSTTIARQDWRAGDGGSERTACTAFEKKQGDGGMTQPN